MTEKYTSCANLKSPPAETKKYANLIPYNVFTAPFMNWCEYFWRKCCQRQIWAVFPPVAICHGPAAPPFVYSQPTNAASTLSTQRKLRLVKTRRLGQQNLIHLLFLLHTLIISSLLSVRVLDRVIIHPDGGPNAESCYRLASLLHAYGSLPSVCHVETNALVLANLCNLGFGCCWGSWWNLIEKLLSDKSCCHAIKNDSLHKSDSPGSQLGVRHNRPAGKSSQFCLKDHIFCHFG